MTDGTPALLRRAQLFRRLASALEHDLRAPLNSVVLATEILRRKSAAGDEDLALLARSLDSFRTKLEAFLEFARFDECAATSRPARLESLVRRVLGWLGPTADARSTRLEWLDSENPGEAEIRCSASCDGLLAVVVLRAIDDAGPGGDVRVQTVVAADRAGIRLEWNVRGAPAAEPSAMGELSDGAIHEWVRSEGGEIRRDGATSTALELSFPRATAEGRD